MKNLNRKSTNYGLTIAHQQNENRQLFQVTACDRFDESPSKQSYRFVRDLSHLDDILWPPDRPLPYPAWGSVPSRLSISSIDEFHHLADALTNCVQRQLETHCYNTIGNFLTLYESYQQRSQSTESLEDLYRDYKPPITDNHHTCVGLGLDMTQRIRELEEAFPGIRSTLFLASCEENIGNVNRYVSTPTPDTHTSEKEHVVISLKIDLQGRIGVILLDPGYHVAHPVIVMEDMLYPHTGWFKPGGTARSQRMYNYTLHPSGRYVLWDIKEIRRGVELRESALIYTHQAFVSPVDCTERRNLVYTFKSLLKRDSQGNVLAGVYFPLKPMEHGQFHLFCQDQNQQQVDFKISFNDILYKKLSDPTHKLLLQCESQLHLNGPSLSQLLFQTASALNDTEFMRQLLVINHRIILLSENN